jgi:hypothetical protein
MRISDYRSPELVFLHSGSIQIVRVGNRPRIAQMSGSWNAI